MSFPFQTLTRSFRKTHALPIVVKDSSTLILITFALPSDSQSSNMSQSRGRRYLGNPDDNIMQPLQPARPGYDDRRLDRRHAPGMYKSYVGLEGVNEWSAITIKTVADGSDNEQRRAEADRYLQEYPERRRKRLAHFRKELQKRKNDEATLLRYVSLRVSGTILSFN
jgi:hypothetical protein